MATAIYKEYVSQYTHFKTKYGVNTCFMMLVGSFYEVYDRVNVDTQEGDTNLSEIAEILHLSISSKIDSEKKESRMIGFPEYSLNKWVDILMREGYTVIVTEQEKTIGNKVKSRPVNRIYSPGTYIETSGSDSPFLVGIWMEEDTKQIHNPPSFSVIALDLTTGSLTTFSDKCCGQIDSWSANTLVYFLQVYSPKECIVWWRGSSLTLPTETIFRRRLGLLTEKCSSFHIESANEEHQGAFEKPIVRKEFLEKVFHNKRSLLPIIEDLRLNNNTSEERVIVALLRFANDHIPSACKQLQLPKKWSSMDGAVYLGNNALSQLNMISDQSVLSIFQKTITPLGKRAMRNRLLYPQSSATIIRNNLNQVSAIKDLSTEIHKQIELYLRSIRDISRLHRKIVMTTINAEDIIALDQSYMAIKKLLSIESLSSALSFTEENKANFNTYLTTQFHILFDVEKARQNSQDISFLSSVKFPHIAIIEKNIIAQNEKAEEVLKQICKWSNITDDSLRLESNESSYYFTGTRTVLVQIQNMMTSKKIESHPFPKIQINFKKSSRGTVEFPQLETLYSHTLNQRAKLKSTVQIELPKVCDTIETDCWSSIEEFVSLLDVTYTLGKVAEERGYVKPEIEDISPSLSSGVSITGLRHPIIELIQTRIEYVKHDISLGFEDTDINGMLLYGLNASGKSSMMKAIGIAVILAQAGSYVPATTMKLRPYTSVLTRILNNDNIFSGLSSFAVEVVELRDIFERADNHSLILGDELCSTTENISASSIVASGVHYLHSVKSNFIFATHLHELSKIDEIVKLPKLGIFHLHVECDPITNRLIYDRTLRPGNGNTLYGLEISKALNMPYVILKKAYEFRREIMGTVSEEKQKSSQWNKSIFRKECEICHNDIVNQLEVHHIKPRSNAIDGKFADKSNMNDQRNLIVLCEKCHDKHHAGVLEVGPLKQTSEGSVRTVVEMINLETTQSNKKSKWSQEQMDIIQSYLRKYPTISVGKIVKDLELKEDITISVNMLGKIRKSI